MRWWQRPDRPLPGRAELPNPGAVLVEECAAFLAGAYPAWLAHHGLGIPPWAWLNPLAHGTPTELAALAARDRTDQTSPADVHDTSWAAVVAMLASGLVDDDDVDRQQEALVRLELQLAAGATQISTPENLFDVARAALERSTGE